LAVLTEVGAGRVKVSLDNSYSRFTSKEVRVRMGVKVSEVKLDEALAGLQVTEEEGEQREAAVREGVEGVEGVEGGVTEGSGGGEATVDSTVSA
jgi:hypothetical protein